MNRYQIRVVETTVFKVEAETEEEARRIASEDCIWGPSEGKYDVWIDVENLEEIAL
jgi:hypothetical protein